MPYPSFYAMPAGMPGFRRLVYLTLPRFRPVYNIDFDDRKIILGMTRQIMAACTQPQRVRRGGADSGTRDVKMLYVHGEPRV